MICQELVNVLEIGVSNMNRCVIHDQTVARLKNPVFHPMLKAVEEIELGIGSFSDVYSERLRRVGCNQEGNAAWLRK